MYLKISLACIEILALSRSSSEAESESISVLKCPIHVLIAA